MGGINRSKHPTEGKPPYGGAGGGQTQRAGHADAAVKGAMPGVRDSHPKPAGVDLAGGTAPPKGQTYRKLQTGSSHPATDAGGGVGNTAGALDSYLKGR